MKKLLCSAIAIVLAASLCACSDNDDTSVKIPDTSNSKVSMTYEEAVAPFMIDETHEQFCDRADMILAHLQCVYSFYNDTPYTYPFETTDPITNENGISDSMNALERYFKTEEQYTEYAGKLSNPVTKDAYLKFSSLAEEIYQAFADNPSKSVTDEINFTALEQYASNLSMGSDVSRAEYYLTSYIGAVERNLWYIEAYCKLTPEEIEKRLFSSSTVYGHHMVNVTSWCPSIELKGSAEGLDLDYTILTLDNLMGLKDNAYAIVSKAYSHKPQKIEVFDEFMQNATKLYNIVRVNRPEFNDTEYIEKQGFDLEPLEEIDALYY